MKTFILKFGLSLVLASGLLGLFVIPEIVDQARAPQQQPSGQVNRLAGLLKDSDKVSGPKRRPRLVLDQSNEILSPQDCIARLRDGQASPTKQFDGEQQKSDLSPQSFRHLDVYKAIDLYVTLRPEERDQVARILEEKLRRKFYEVSLPTAPASDKKMMQKYMKTYGLTEEVAESYRQDYIRLERQRREGIDLLYRLAQLSALRRQADALESMNREIADQNYRQNIYQWTPSGPIDSTFDPVAWFYQQRAEQRCRQQECDRQLYQQNMLNSLQGINYELERFRQQEWSRQFEQQIRDMDRFK